MPVTHPAIKSTPVVCGVCGLPIHESETGIRHFGFYIAHSQNRCIYLLRAKVDEEKKWADYRRDVLAKIWSIIADGQRALDPDADPEYDTNNLYDLVREGVEAKKKLAEGEREIAKLLEGRMGEAAVKFDRVLAAVAQERERCARIAESVRPGVTTRRIAEIIRSWK